MTDQPMVNLNITDISDAVKVIDHAADQGAFHGWDNIRQILALRDRLDAFVVAANAVTATPSDGPTIPVVNAVEEEDAVNSAELPVVARRRQSRARSERHVSNA